MDMKNRLRNGATYKKPTKKATLASVADYRRYAEATDVHVTPAGTHVNSGAHGNLFEMEIKLALGNFHFVRVAKRSMPDTFKKLDGVKTIMEIKQGCGELAVIDRDGNLLNSEMTADYVIFAPFYEAGDNAAEKAYMIPGDDFVQFLDDCGLIREKYSSSMYMENPADPDGKKILIPGAYHDRIAIQSYKNSKKKMALIAEQLDGYDTIAEWVAENL